MPKAKVHPTAVPDHLDPRSHHSHPHHHHQQQHHRQQQQQQQQLRNEHAATKNPESKSADFLQQQQQPQQQRTHHHRMGSGGGVRVRNDSADGGLQMGVMSGTGSALSNGSAGANMPTTGPPLQQRHHRKTSSGADSMDTSDGEGADNASFSSSGGERSGSVTPRFHRTQKELGVAVARSLTSAFEAKVNKMHSSLALNPSGVFWQWWSLLVCLLMLYTIVVLPVEVPFDEVVGHLFYPDLVVDILFVVDMILLFFVGYNDAQQGRVIMDLKTIREAYLKSWFVVDLVALLPFSPAYALTGYTSDALQVLRILKFIRFARLPRMFRTLQKSDPLNALEDVVGLSFAIKALVGHLTRLLVLCHWLACCWCLAAEAQIQARERESWMTEYGVQNEAWSTVYLSALYWSVMTFTTIGYGDVVPTNNIERGVSIVSMILAATYYAYLVGAISTIINTSNQASHDFQSLMDNLNRWLQEYNCDAPLRRRLRHFFNLSQPLLKDKYYDDVLAKMSPGLRGEFCASLYSQSLARVEFLQPPKSISADRKTQFLGILAQKLQPQAYPAGEQLIREGDGTSDATSLMFIVRRGLLGARGRVVRTGGVVGEDIICRSSRRWYRVMCLTFVDALTLSHADLFETLESSSDLSEQLLKVRKAANRHALRTTIMEICRRVRLLKLFLRSAEAAAMGLGSPHSGGFKHITVRLDSDQYFDKSGEIFDPMKKVQELVQKQQEQSAMQQLHEQQQLQSKLGPDSGPNQPVRLSGRGGTSANSPSLSRQSSMPGSPMSPASPSIMRRRSTAELKMVGEHAVLHLSDAVNRQETVFDVLSRLDSLNIDAMSPVEALTFLDCWKKELIKMDLSLEDEGSSDGDDGLGDSGNGAQEGKNFQASGGASDTADNAAGRSVDDPSRNSDGPRTVQEPSRGNDGSMDEAAVVLL